MVRGTKKESPEEMIGLKYQLLFNSLLEVTLAKLKKVKKNKSIKNCLRLFKERLCTVYI